MKKIFLLLLLFSLLFAYYGKSTIEVEKEWIITGKPSKINFTGLFLLNDSNQKIVKIYVDKPLDIIYDGEKVLVSYYGDFDGDEIFHAHAVVEVFYDPKITQEFALPSAPINQGGLVDYDEKIAEASRSLAQPSSLATTIILSNWVYENMVYDLSYSGKNLPAKKIFTERRGVCTEYVHLFIAMANSLGLKTRYIGGYVMTGNWQPHAWAQVYLQDRWVSFDPTFAEGGVLSSNHVAVSYGKDADDIYDKVQSTDEVDIHTAMNFNIIEEKKSDENISLNFSFDDENKILFIQIKNNEDYFAIGSYTLLLSETYGGKKKKVIAIAPGATYSEEIPFKGDFRESFIYHIPFELSLNDNLLSNEITIKVKRKEESSKSCILTFILFAFALFFYIAKKKHGPAVDYTPKNRKYNCERRRMSAPKK